MPIQSRWFPCNSLAKANNFPSSFATGDAVRTRKTWDIKMFKTNLESQNICLTEKSGRREQPSVGWDACLGQESQFEILLHAWEATEHVTHAHRPYLFCAHVCGVHGDHLWLCACTNVSSGTLHVGKNIPTKTQIHVSICICWLIDTFR